MKLLKISILIVFLLCVVGAGHTGGFFGILEAGLLWELFTRGNEEGLLALLILIPQIAGIIAIRKSNNRLMIGITIFLHCWQALPSR